MSRKAHDNPAAMHTQTACVLNTYAHIIVHCHCVKLHASCVYQSTRAPIPYTVGCSVALDMHNKSFVTMDAYGEACSQLAHQFGVTPTNTVIVREENIAGALQHTVFTACHFETAAFHRYRRSRNCCA